MAFDAVCTPEGGARAQELASLLADKRVVTLCTTLTMETAEIVAKAGSDPLKQRAAYMAIMAALGVHLGALLAPAKGRDAYLEAFACLAKTVSTDTRKAQAAGA